MLCLKYNIWYQLLFWFIVIVFLLLFCNCMLLLFKEVVIIFLMYIHIYEVKIIPCFQYINTVYFNFLFPFKIIIILSWKFQLFCFWFIQDPTLSVKNISHLAYWFLLSAQLEEYFILNSSHEIFQIYLIHRGFVVFFINS